jgi:hypothetical protein
MAFTYTGDPSVSTRDQIRFLIADTDSTDPHFTDEELAWQYTTWENVWEAAASCAEILAGRFAKKADSTKKVGDLSLSQTYARAADNYFHLSDHLRLQRSRLFAPVPVVNAQALKSTEYRNVETYNTDFYLGIDDFEAPPGSTTTGSNT